MRFDLTPLQPAAIALACQALTGLLLGDWLLGAAFGVAYILWS